MGDYYNRNNRKKKRSRREKIGFYTAFSICLIAVAMAVYSTYNTLSDTATLTEAQTAEQVGNEVTGVTETVEAAETQAATKIDLTIPTAVATQAAEVFEENTETEQDSSRTALETMLSADVTLGYPLSSNNVLREYCEESVYYKTLNVWKPHTGVDFSGELGDDVFAMSDGSVTDVYEDEMYGNTVEISLNNIVCVYSGLGSVSVKKGDSVEINDKIGTLGAVPCEASDANHIHISVKVDGEYADPLSFIGNDE
ncbi:MAG: M23 family metallopeptidase [Clostridiales bacterium]|nr:M23 family metallopeptidase [Clostridiales bacterium]